MTIDLPNNSSFSEDSGNSIAFEWEADFLQRWEQKYKRAQVFVDTSVLRYSEPYMPFRSGMLIKTGITSTVVGSGVVEWRIPYARYLYYGKVMIDPKIKAAGFLTSEGWRSRKGAVKVLTNRNIKYDATKNPLEGSLWVPRMWADRKQDILGGARSIMGGGQ